MTWSHSLIRSNVIHPFDQLYSPPMTSEPVRKDEILLSSNGRPPWYTPTGKAVPSYVIGIAGGSASGKTHVATSILRQLNHIPTCLILSQDSFYNKLNAEKEALAHKNELDLDAPEAIDMKLFAQASLCW
jgi:uridine kinase